MPLCPGEIVLDSALPWLTVFPWNVRVRLCAWYCLGWFGFRSSPLDSELAPWLGVDWNPDCETWQMRVCIGLGVSRVDYLFALGVRTS